MLESASMKTAEKPVQVEVHRPFRVNEGGTVRETKPGETVTVPLYLARELAGHTPPKIGPKGSYKPPTPQPIKAAA